MAAVIKWGELGERRDLEIKQGGTFGPINVTLRDEETQVPLDLTGCQFKGQIRKKSTTAVAAEMRITEVDLPNGNFEFYLTDEDTTAIPAGETIDAATSLYTWDFYFEDSLGAKHPLFYGDVSVFRAVTHA